MTTTRQDLEALAADLKAMRHMHPVCPSALRKAESEARRIAATLEGSRPEGQPIDTAPKSGQEFLFPNPQVAPVAGDAKCSACDGTGKRCFAGQSAMPYGCEHCYGTGLASPLAEQQPAPALPANPWKDAVIDETIVAHIYTAEHETNPKKAIQDAISWNVMVALDPAVSSDAEALVERGRKEATQQPAHVEVPPPEVARFILRAIAGEWDHAEYEVALAWAREQMGRTTLK